MSTEIIYTEVTKGRAYDLAVEAKNLLDPIPENKWIADRYTDFESRCCVIGHWTRLHSPDPTDYSQDNCSDFFESPLRHINEPFGIAENIVEVNNDDVWYEVENPGHPKARVMAFLDQIISDYQVEQNNPESEDELADAYTSQPKLEDIL